MTAVQVFVIVFCGIVGGFLALMAIGELIEYVESEFGEGAMMMLIVTIAAAIVATFTSIWYVTRGPQ